MLRIILKLLEVKNFSNTSRLASHVIFSKVLRKVGDKIDESSGVYEDTMLHKCVKLNRVK